MARNLSADMYPFAKRNVLPRMEDLSDEQRATLPDNVTHLEYLPVQAFGRTAYALHAWPLGYRRPMRWVENKEYTGWRLT